MTKDDVLFGYRLQLFDLAGRTTVSHACRTFGVHRSTYYRWKAQVDRQGLEMLRPRERRRPVMPNQLPLVVEERIVAFSLGHPGLGPRRIAAMLARPEWGDLVVSPNGVYKVLCRHGLSTRAKRLSLIAGYRAPYEPPREPVPEPHLATTKPGELVGIDCFYVGRLHGTKGRRLAADGDRHLLELYVGRAGALRRPRPRPGPDQSLCPTRRAHVAPGRLADAARAHRQRQRVPESLPQSDRGARRAPDQDPAWAPADQRACRTRAPHDPRRVRRPVFARLLYLRYRGLQRELDAYLHIYNHHRADTGRITQGRCPADLVYGARKMKPR